METLNLNLIPTGANPVAHVSQYDEGRVIRFNLFEGSSVYTLDGTETIECDVKKPDGNVVTLAVTNTSSTYVDVTTTLQMCACSGESLGDIKITKGAVIIATLNFILSVERSPLENGVESDSAIHNLKTTISDMVKEEIEAISPEEELSGAMASFETHEIAPLVDCKVKIEAIQEAGTPTPSSPKAITGFTGANIKVVGNLLNDSNKYQFSYNTVMLGESAGDTYSTHLKATTYTISFKRPTSVPFKVYYNKLGGSAIDVMTYGQTTNASFTVAEEGDYRFVAYYNSGAVAPTDITEIMLTGGSEVKPYKAYTTPTTTAISWNDEAGTVYGGSLNVTTGELTITQGGKTFTGDASESWVEYTAYNGFWIQVNDMESGTRHAGLCNRFETSYINAHTTNSVWFGVSNNRLFLVECSATTGATVADLKTWLSSNNVTIVYPLATPQTIQLTPTEIKTILGVNNIWADTGDIDVVYHHELTARYVYFDNTGTDLTATNVETAIKELWSRLQ